jgi:hypothetical protein
MTPMNRTIQRIAFFAAAMTASCSSGSAPPVAAHREPQEQARIIAYRPFEGEITLAVLYDPASPPYSVKYEIRGTDVRYEPVGGAEPKSIFTIADLASREARVVSDGRKWYVEVATSQTPSSILPKANAIFRPTGAWETVAGYECEVWRMSRGSETLDACVVRGVPFVDVVRWPPYRMATPAWADELTRAVAFPLKLVVWDRAGNHQLRFEATSVEEKPIDQSRFTVPAGYRKIATAKDAVFFGID